MAFTKVDKKRHAGSRPRSGSNAWLRMSAYLADEKTRRCIGFYIGNDIINHLELNVDNAAPRSERSIIIYEGTHGDAGYWMMIKDTEGYAVGCPNKLHDVGAFMISMDRIKHYVLNEVPMPPTNVEYVKSSDNDEQRSVLIQVPDWLRYNSLSVAENKVVPPREEPKVVVIDGRNQRRKTK